MGMTSKRIGAISEQAMTLAALKKGWLVYSSVGDLGKTDLIFETDTNSLLRIQCKTGRVASDAVEFPTYNAHVRESVKVMDRYSAAEIDYFGVFCPELNKCYLVPVGIANRSHRPRLRLRPPKSGNSNPLFAAAFEF